MGKDDSKDTFWDIEELLPPKPVKKPKKPTAFPDTEAITVDVGEILDELADAGIAIPMREERHKKERKVLREYEPQSGFLQKVTISPWPSDFHFYQKFRRDAIRLFEREHEACEYVYFFSYMPQYDQMTASQLSYYLYWRGEIRKGSYLKTDINYLFLYTYEILNLPDRVPPEKGAIMLSRLWAAYREDFRYLDKYLGEWLCDYCLVHKVEPDWVTLDVFAGEIASKVSMPEFYLHGGALTWALAETIVAYDYRKSKYYEAYAEEFDTHIPRAVEAIAKKLIAPHLADYGIEPTRVLRDSFSGAVACHDIKFKITVMCTPLRRSLELKQTMTGIVKLCENNLRAAFGIKSRFVPSGVSEEVKAAVSAYFDAIYPERNMRKKKTAAALEEERYMALYEPENKGPADISRALAIEEAAWETADLLDTGEDSMENDIILPQETVPKEHLATSFPMPEPTEPDGDFAFIGTLDGFLSEALAAASEGKFDAFCRGKGKMTETVRASLNELAMDAIGDMIIEEDFSLVCDYEEDILAELRKR